MSFMLLGILNSQAAGGGAGAYDLLETVEGNGTFSSLTFSSIPNGYKHLQIRYVGIQSSSSSTLFVRFNSDSGGNYTLHRLVGTGSSVVSGGFTGFTGINLGGIASFTTTFNAGIIDILDYSNSNKNTTTRALNQDSNVHISLRSSLWNNTEAVTSITVANSPSSNFTSASRWSLYGIK